MRTMKNAKTFFYIICLLYIAASFVFIFFHERIFDLFDRSTLDFLKIWAVAGLVIFLLEIVWGNVTLSNRKREANKLKKDIESLKAKIYDMEEKERGNEKALKAFENSLKPKQ